LYVHVSTNFEFENFYCLPQGELRHEKARWTYTEANSRHAVSSDRLRWCRYIVRYEIAYTAAASLHNNES